MKIKKLSLNKETLAKLGCAETDQVNGGIVYTVIENATCENPTQVKVASCVITRCYAACI